MGGIGLVTEHLNWTPPTHVRTHIHKRTYIYLHTPAYNNMHLYNKTHMHTICTQYAHRTHTHNTEYRIQNTDTTINNMQHIHLNTEILHTYFWFYVYDNISKNSIIQLYTNYIQTIYILLALLMRWAK